jgi:hypothetical protein
VPPIELASGMELVPSLLGGVMGIAKHPLATDESVAFRSGELEGTRPRALCTSCREALKREAATYGPFCRRSRLLCFHCYRADLERTCAVKASGELDTASEARFQAQLPFEPVNRSRLRMLKAERSEARAAASRGIGQYVEKQRLAQIKARYALQATAASPKARELTPAGQVRATVSAIHAAELQMADVWVPLVVSR